MNFETIIIEKRDGTATITLNRPEALNAMSHRMLEELEAAFDNVEKDDDVRVVVITGAGDRAFSAGADVKELAKHPTTGTWYGKHFWKIEKMSKPVIAAVNGYALGGGTEIALCCDIIIASENAKLGIPEAVLGGTAPVALARLQQLVGRSKAKEIMFTGDMIDAKEAERIGLVNQVVAKDELLSAARKMAEKIIEKSPIAISLIKATVNMDLGPKDFELPALVHNFCAAVGDSEEGFKAFVEKRKPKFRKKTGWIAIYDEYKPLSQ